MFDPHGIRRSKRRTNRKGQIIQAKAVSDPFVINPLHVNAYKEFIIKNHLIDTTPDPSPGPTPEPTPQPTTPVFQETWHQIMGAQQYILGAQQTVTFARISSSKAEIYTISNTSNSAITVNHVEFYCKVSSVTIDLTGETYFNKINATLITETDTDISLLTIQNPILYVPEQWLLNSLE